NQEIPLKCSLMPLLPFTSHGFFERWDRGTGRLTVLIPFFNIRVVKKPKLNPKLKQTSCVFLKRSSLRVFNKFCKMSFSSPLTILTTILSPSTIPTVKLYILANEGVLLLSFSYECSTS